MRNLSHYKALVRLRYDVETVAIVTKLLLEGVPPTEAYFQNLADIYDRLTAILDGIKGGDDVAA